MNATLEQAGGVASLAGKIALVTGGTSGIGRGCCVALARAGAYVVVTGRSVDKERPTYGGAKGGAETLEMIEAAGGKGHFSVLDVTLEEHWKRAMEEVREQFGRLDILVNNAGRSLSGSLHQTPLEDLLWEIDINIEGAFMGTNYAWPLMTRLGGSIFYTNSTGGQHGNPNMFAYPASKAALIGLAKAAAEDGKPFGIRSISLHPGGTWTNGTKTVGGYANEEEYLADVRRSGKIPLGRPAYPADVGAAVVYLSSDAARHITGIEFNIDGGGSAGVPGE
jgi:NAD(P)-dependent dehydrogenase (short-subunit alcohol dehydrogenase family)